MPYRIQNIPSQTSPDLDCLNIPNLFRTQSDPPRLPNPNQTHQKRPCLNRAHLDCHAKLSHTSSQPNTSSVTGPRLPYQALPNLAPACQTWNYRDRPDLDCQTLPNFAKALRNTSFPIMTAMTDHASPRRSRTNQNVPNPTPTAKPRLAKNRHVRPHLNSTAKTRLTMPLLAASEPIKPSHTPTALPYQTSAVAYLDLTNAHLDCHAKSGLIKAQPTSTARPCHTLPKNDGTSPS